MDIVDEYMKQTDKKIQALDVSVTGVLSAAKTAVGGVREHGSNIKVLLDKQAATEKCAQDTKAAVDQAVQQASQRHVELCGKVEGALPDMEDIQGSVKALQLGKVCRCVQPIMAVIRLLSAFLTIVTTGCHGTGCGSIGKASENNRDACRHNHENT